MAQLETRSEQLKADRFDRRVEIINGLESLISSNPKRSDVENFLQEVRLIGRAGTDIGLGGLDDMEEWGNDTFQENVGKLILELRKENGEFFDKSEVESISTLATKIQEGVTETTKDVDTLTTTLEKITEGRYLSVEAMNEALKCLQGVNVAIPEAEIARLNSLRPTGISEADMAKMETMKAQSEGEKGPMVMQLPEKIMVDGEEKPFTIATMEAVMKKATNADSLLKPLWVSSDYVPGKNPKKLKDGEEDIYNKVWSSDLQAWTSACLKGSKNKNYKDQLEHQAEILGEGNEIEADMFLAMTLRYISSKEELMRQDYMRLNTRDTDGDPLHVNVDDDDLNLNSSNSNAYSSSGLGASLRISS